MNARKMLIWMGFAVLLIFVGGSFLFGASDDSDDPVAEVPQQSLVEPSGIMPTGVSRDFTTTRQFTSAEFKQAYDELSLPNITPIVVSPSITGSLDADRRIQMLAESRGYQLRHVSSGLLNEIEGLPIQEELIGSWVDLQQMAREEGIQISFRSGYRSVEEQRELFVDRLRIAGGVDDLVAAGEQDDLVNNVLAITAPPGYSRHHSGYTIDVEDPGFAVFANSSAYAWLAADNFEKAKLHGFIPSYPEGLTNQGPNPEPWEYVWVGPLVTYE